jgi:glycosyltransferase involved in cell wall biosynthesis
MRISVNCLRTYPDYKGGVNSFTLGLIDGFAQLRTPHSFILFVANFNRAMFSRYEELDQFRIVEINETSRKRVRNAYFRLRWWIRDRIPPSLVNRMLSVGYVEQLDAAADVHYVPYCPPVVFPYVKKPSVYSIHDIQHAHFPEFFTAEQLSERRTIFEQCIRHATVIQASSAHMQRDFLEHFPTLAENRIAVIPEGVDIPTFARPRDLAEVKTRYGLPDAFLFFPAQLWHHKNHITILRSLKRLRDSGSVIPLVLTGAKYEASQRIFDYVEANGLAGQVQYLGIVPFDDLVALYQGARFLITAVLYESSSIPVLEAAAAGTPIIASRTPPNEELARHLSMTLFAPTDDEELAELLSQIWHDHARGAEQAAHNRVAIARFSWRNAAQRYIALFESIGPVAGKVREEVA